MLGELFKTFVRIGAFTLGGGYAMIPLIEEEVVNRHKWVEQKDFLDLIAVSQSCPGVFAINISTMIGYRLRKTPGAIVCALASALPSLLIILAIAMFFASFWGNETVESIFRGIRPAVVALIAVPTFRLAKSAGINLGNCWIPVVSAIAIYLMGINPVFVIISAAVGGYLYGLFLSDN